MNVLIIVSIGVAAAAGVGGWWYWRRRRRESRLISLVALLRQPVEFDPLVLAKTAGRAWDADLGDGSGEGEDGFVVCSGPFNTIVHGGRAYLLNSIPAPYVDDPQQAAESIVDLRTRQLFSEHRAWFSCDALWVDHRSSAELIAECYRELARLFAEFLDENCLLIYLPDTRKAYAINEDTERALLADDPLAALDGSRTLPVVGISEDDPLMQQAVAEAHKTWLQFVAAYEARDGENFSVKAPVTYADVTEFIWVSVTAVEGDQIYGTLGNEPANLGPLKLGSKVCVSLSDLNDWCYIDPQGDLRGGFTIAVIQQAARRQQNA
jgi:uncharacterized protein YegJ (DUF2314 family)